MGVAPRLMELHSLRSLAKRLAFAIATVAVAPALLSFRLRASVVGKDRAFESSSQTLSLFPGVIGEYLRRAFYHRTLAHCHPSVVIGFGTVLSKCSASIAENVVIGPKCQVGWVRIARDVLVGPGCHLPSGGRTHGTDDPTLKIRDQAGELVQVNIGEGAWIGSAAIVLADVGEHSVVAAGSLVHQAIPAGVVAGGVPARVLKRRERPPTPEVVRP